jgi:serine/threonine-protein phosphatase CPPED1
MDEIWKEKFGRRYYEFVYRDVLFLVLNSEDPPGHDPGRISDDQLAWLKKVLDDNKNVRWTLVFLHKPMWMLRNPHASWTEVEKLLNGRKHTVFAGHVHFYRKAVRQGMNYYSLATTGGDSRLRGVEYGEFDHITWVTMKKDGPVLANILLDGILREDLAPFASDEEGFRHYYRRPTHPVVATVYHDGKPAAGAFVTLRGKGKEPRQPYADGLVESDGTLKLSTYEAFDGVPEGEYAVTVELRKPLWTAEGKRGPNLLPDKYADSKTTPLTFTVKRGDNKLQLNLEK